VNVRALGNKQEEYEAVGIDPSPLVHGLLVEVLAYLITENDLRDEHGLPRRTDY
jgi:hypothetical protein